MKLTKTRRKPVTLRDVTLLRDAFDTRIRHLQRAIDGCAGSLWPGIYAGQINDLKALFEKITGYPYNTPGEG